MAHGSDGAPPAGGEGDGEDARDSGAGDAGAGDDDGSGLRGGRVAPTFLYYALPYDEAVRRAVTWEVENG